MRFVDANVFLRYLTRDDPDKAEQVRALLQRADRGEEELTTSESVIMELVFILSSPRLYKLDRERVRALLTPLVSAQGLRLAKRSTILRALELFASTSVDFVDALAVAQMEANKITEIYSYDKHFDQFETVKRLEP